MNTIAEIEELRQWLGAFERSPRQIFSLNECDCEVLELPGGVGYLAATIDSIAEEVQIGLYRDPYTAGWMTVMSSLSDLAACGAQPLGFLLSSEWERNFPLGEKKRVAAGIRDALSKISTFLLGGDSGTVRAGTTLAGVGIGLCPRRPPGRVGIQPGDIIAITGQTGTGPAFGLRHLRGEPNSEFPEDSFRPVARVPEGQALCPLAHAVMDTSDGVLSTLDTLSALNRVGFDLEWNPSSLAPSAVDYCARQGLPLWLLWAAELGDLELLGAFAPQEWDQARQRVPGLRRIGVANQGTSRVLLPAGGSEPIPLDLGYARNLFRSQPLSQAFDILEEESRAVGLP